MTCQVIGSDGELRVTIDDAPALRGQLMLARPVGARQLLAAENGSWSSSSSIADRIIAIETSEFILRLSS
jgi:hypothetical protein